MGMNDPLWTIYCVYKHEFPRHSDAPTLRMLRRKRYNFKSSNESFANRYLPPLPRESVLLILFYLRNDKKSLHSCLFVNRFWCQETIKILWSEPFKLLYTCKKKQCHCSPEKRRSQAANLLLTYLSCLLHKYKDPCLQHDPTLKLPPPPLFEYIDYLKGLDLNELYSAVEDWTKISKQRPRSPVISKVFKEICYFYEGHCKDDRDVTLDYVEFMKILNTSLDKEIRPKYTEHYYTGFLVHPNYSNRDLMVYMILKTFMTRCPKLERISIDLRRIYTRGPKEYFCSELKKERAPRLEYRHLPTEIYETLHSYSGDGPCLKQLSEVVCVTRRRKTSLLLSLTKFAPNIKYLVATIAYRQHFLDGDLERNYEKPKVEEEAASLATLIQSQKALSHFGLHMCSEGLPVVMSALKSQIDSLSSLSFVNMKNLNHKVLIGIKPLKKLQKLSFQLCTFQSDGSTFRSTNPEFPCLTELDLNGTFASDEMLENLLLMCPSALKSLNLGKRNIKYHFDSQELPPHKLINLISTLFPNLMHFKASIYPNEILQLYSLLSSCFDLTTLDLVGATQKSDDETSRLFLNLSEANLETLQNLKKLRLKGMMWSFSPFSFETFLRNSKLLEKLETLEIADSRDFGNQHLQVIIRCLEGTDKVTVRQINLDTCSLVSSRLLNKAKEMVVDNAYNNNDIDKLEKKHVICQKFLDLLKYCK